MVSHNPDRSSGHGGEATGSMDGCDMTEQFDLDSMRSPPDLVLLGGRDSLDAISDLGRADCARSGGHPLSFVYRRESNVTRAATRLARVKQRNPADVYNEKRRIVIAGFIKDPAEARKWLERYRSVLGPQGYAGLKAELDFFERFGNEFSLRPALDAGESVDFSGIIDGVMTSFDVTTNIDFKKLTKYEPLQSRVGTIRSQCLMAKTSSLST
jgi:hypothetical protein